MIAISDLPGNLVGRFEGKDHGSSVSFFIGTFTLSSFAGPGIGGALTDGPGWRWCFLINLPMGAIAIW